VENPYAGQAPYSGQMPAEPGLWLGLSIGASLLCCQPLGIVGIVFSALAMESRNRGDVYGWERRVGLARTWTLWSIGIGVLPVIALVIAFAVNPDFASQ
jgi:hypothetical protein